MEYASIGFLAALWAGSLAARLLPARLVIGGAAACGATAGRIVPARTMVAGNLRKIADAGDPILHERIGAGIRSGEVRPERVFASYGRYWGEFVCAGARPGATEELLGRIRVEGVEHIDDAARRGPVCVLTGHLGNWDLGARWLARRVGRLAVVAEELRPAVLTRLCSRLRGDDLTLVITGTGSGLRLYRHLRKGGHAALVADRVVAGGDENQAVPFLGGRRWFPAGGILLARRAGAALVPAFLLRRPGGYVIRVHPPISPVEDPVARFARILENEVRQNPEQWCVLYPVHDAEASRGERVV